MIKMFRKCINFTYQKSLCPVVPLRPLHTTSCYFIKSKSEPPPDSEDGKESPNADAPSRRKSFLTYLKEHRKRTMMIDELPEKETISTLLKVQRVNQSFTKSFKTVYKFPAIKYFGLVNRIKIYQTGVTVLAALATGITFIADLPVDFCWSFTKLSLCACFTFYSIGYAAADFIGFIYYDEKHKIVRIAYVDSWGRRRDIEVPISDIIPAAEAPVGFVNKLWFPLRRYSTDETLKLQLEQGLILEPKILRQII